MTITFGRSALLFHLLCVVSCAFASSLNFKWDIEPSEHVVGAIPPTFYEYSSPPDSNETMDTEKLADCESVLGKWKSGKWIHKSHENYNGTESRKYTQILLYTLLDQVLANLGGYPGRIDVIRNDNAPEAVFIDTDPSERPLPFPPRKNWVYEYNVTDYASYIRLEQATKRFAGKPQGFLDIRGKVAWTPANFCGQMLLAFYRLDDTGFHYEIRPSAMQFQNNGTVIAIRHAPVCLEGTDGHETCI